MGGSVKRAWEAIPEIALNWRAIWTWFVCVAVAGLLLGIVGAIVHGAVTGR